MGQNQTTLISVWNGCELHQLVRPELED